MGLFVGRKVRGRGDGGVRGGEKMVEGMEVINSVSILTNCLFSKQ